MIRIILLLGLILGTIMNPVLPQEIPQSVSELVFKIDRARLDGSRLARIEYSGILPDNFNRQVKISPHIDIQRICVTPNRPSGQDDSPVALQNGGIVELETSEPFELNTHYYLLYDEQKKFLMPAGILDSLYSDKALGFRREGAQLAFRVFAPRALSVRMVIYERHDDPAGQSVSMNRDEDGVWEYMTSEDLTGKYYTYRIAGPTGEGEIFDAAREIADPYSPAVVSRNHYTHPAKTLILPPDDFDWEGDTWVDIPHRDLLIYEMHIRDLTADPSSGVAERLRGSYLGLTAEDQQGGLPYLRALGINAVELLPAQDFANIEVPFRDSTVSTFNTWNPYARNHWGYMTSYFFAPESYYATGGTMKPGEYNGADGRQVREFKEMVKTFHKNGIAVLMDVVYNHVSEYDYNPFKYIDKFYYFHLTDDCRFEGRSGCGNDFKTERLMARRMIIESVKYWMTEYHIDGFRFDLAAMIDRETCRQILAEARKINPNVIIIAEPWGGGGYDPAGFSDIGWAAWNDQIRNALKGWDPLNDRGFIFGEWKQGMDRKGLERSVIGTPREYGGLFTDISHSINYLEAHDNHTLGDFIRLSLHPALEKARITDLESHTRLKPEELKLNKLAALALLTSQGPVMLHEGQEFARSKVIAQNEVGDSAWGHIDHNSYEKDNPTNWLNFQHARINDRLLQYYRDLIRLRKQHRAFRHAMPGQFSFLPSSDPFLLAYTLSHESGTYLVALNGNREKQHDITLPEGQWELLVDENQVYPDQPKAIRQRKIRIHTSSGVVLKRR